MGTAPAATLQSAKIGGEDTEMDYVEESALYKVDLRIN